MQLICCDLSKYAYIEDYDFFNDAVGKISGGEFSLNPITIINTLLSKFQSEIRETVYYIIIFFCIAAITSIISIQGGLKKSGMTEMSFFACYITASTVAIKLFGVCLGYVVSVVSEMSDFITKLSPVLMTLLISSGNCTSAVFYHPVLSAAVYVVSLVCKSFIIPLASYSIVLSVINNTSEHIQISGASKMINSIAKWILALVFTLFTGICGIYGFTAGSMDVLGAKTVKFAVNSLIPVVGGLLSDTLETVVSSSMLMKNAVGVSGMLVICSIALMPILKIGAMTLSIKLASVFVEPISDGRISKLLRDISESVTILFGMVVTFAVLFIITISIILSATRGI